MLGINDLDRRDYADWNDTVRGFMRLWDIAEIVGLTPCLASQLEHLPESGLAACLAQKGNCRETYMRLFVLCLRELVSTDPHAAESAAGTMYDEELHSVLDSALLSNASPFLQLLPGYRDSEKSLAATGTS